VIAALAGLLAEAHRVLFFTGAGISTASGIPDYRGPNGVWKTRRPVRYPDFMSSLEERRRYWQQKLDDAVAFGDATPTRVHTALVEWEESGRLEAIVTQNVDGLHSLAGTSPDRLVELHGTNRAVECQSCGARSTPEPHFAAFRATGEPPMCHCGGFLKPATISFGQSLRVADIVRASAAADRCDLVVVLGSTLSVNPAASIPLHGAERGVPYVIVNRGPTDHDGLWAVTLRIESDVEEVLPPAVARVLEGGPG